MTQPSQPLPPTRPPSYNLDGQLSTDLFQRIMIRLKVHKVIKHWKKLSKNSFNRYKRIEQWVNTQKTYIDDMHLIIDQIQKPLREKELITEEQEKIIFPNLNSIIMLSEKMHQTMKGFLETWHPIKTEIADVVTKLAHFFKIYIEYFNNFEKGKEILAGIQDEKAYKVIEKSLKMDIASYLIKPVQRPLKYKLLLTDYQKKLRMDHPDYHALTKAIEMYHQVVEKTNQAMQNQKHMRRMVQMQAKFKNILQSSRQWKFEFQAWFEEHPQACKVYVFTDLVLVIGLKFGRREEMLCKMFLDGTSFVEAGEEVVDWKRKSLFVAGREQVGHFAFSTLQERNRIFEKLSKIINSIHVNEWKRRQEISKVQSRRFSSTRYSKPYFLQDYYEMYDNFHTLKKKFRVTVAGVQRRAINKCLNSYFVIKLQLPFPQVINQKTFVKLQDLIDLERILEASMNKWALVKAENLQKIKWKTIQQLPKQLNKSNHPQIDSLCLQYRARLIQTFLNFILRNRQTLKTSNLIFFKLKMFQSLYERLIDDKYQCEVCEICHNGDIISSYEAYQEELEKRLAEKALRKEENLCVERSFHSQNRLASLSKQKPRCTIEEILLYINSKMGVINQALTNRIIQGDPVKITIYRPHWRDIIGDQAQKRDKWVEVDIYKRDTVGNVLEMMRKSLGLNGVKDFGLVLVSGDELTHKLLHEDEYIMDVIRQNNLQITSTQRKDSVIQSKSGIKGFFSKIKQKMESKDYPTLIVPSCRIQFRKLFMFPQDIQIFSCANDTTRYQLLIDQIFYLFKSKTLNLHHTNIVKLCALFVCIQWNARFPYMKKEEIAKPLLSEIIPQARLHLVNENFVRQVWNVLTIYKEKNIRERAIFQAQVIGLVADNPGWNMQFFIAENLYPCLSLPDKYLKIGINHEQFYIVRENNYLAPVAKINIEKLNVKFSGFLMVVLEEEREYRLMCDDVFMFRCVLQKYEAYNRYFLGRDRNLGRPLMQETI